MKKSCSCESWEEGTKQIIAAQMMFSVHGGEYTSQVFNYCPWCGMKLEE